MYYISYYFHKSQYKSYQTSSRKRKYQLVAKDGLFERHAYIKKHINISIAQKEEGPNLPFMLIIIMAWNLGKSLVIIIIIIEACQLAASLHVSNNSIPAMSPACAHAGPHGPVRAAGQFWLGLAQPEEKLGQIAKTRQKIRSTKFVKLTNYPCMYLQQFDKF